MAVADTKKRSKAEQDKINRKAKLTRARNKRSLSAPKKAGSPAKRKRRSPAKRKGFLSAMTGAEGKNAFRALASGGVGGTLYLIYEDQVDLGTTTNIPEKKAAIAIFGAYLLATMGKKPDTAAGIAGAALYDFFKTKGLLSDASGTQMARMNYADPLKNIPEQLSDNDMYLMQSNQMSLQDSKFDLQDGSGFYQPPYADTTSF